MLLGGINQKNIPQKIYNLEILRKEIDIGIEAMII